MRISMKRIGLIVLAAALVVSVATADGGGGKKGWKGKGSKSVAVSNKAEVGLIGIKLYDTGLDVVKKFGSPDQVQDVAQGTSAGIGPAGGAGAGRSANNQSAGQGGNGGNGAAQAAANWNLPGLDYTPIDLVQGRAPQRAGASGQGGPPAGAGVPQGPPNPGPSGGAAPGAGAGATGTDTRVLYTRWVYKRGNSRFAFILNKFMQVIQIEAIGTNDNRVNTNRGVRYGSSFADIIKRYGAPDGYEINGDSLVVRYLVNNKVAFRLNRLVTDKPHVVTAVVVAAGKM